MIDKGSLTLFHSPNSRSAGALLLLEELGAKYELKVLNLSKNEQRKPEYLAINSMGKVPAVLHNGALVTEQVAIYLYLADLFPEAGLAPALGDVTRGPYLRWMAFYGSCFEPAVCDKALKRDPAPAMMSPYGDYDSVVKSFVGQLEKGAFFLGDKISAVDILWGTSLSWMRNFKLVPDFPVIKKYVEVIAARPAQARAKSIDAKLVATAP
jgi:glutathione S-transferase